MKSADLFSATVDNADARFRDACAEANAELRRFEHPLPGPRNEALAISTCCVGPADSARRLLVISGTHGIEGFAGAAIQTGWLRSGCIDRLPPDTCAVMAHMVNPWGMAWGRRETEDNVDLFRNLLYWEHPSNPDPLFDAVDDALDLEHWSEIRTTGPPLRAAALIKQYGRDRLLEAIRRGQHHRPKSMTYHGNGATWSCRRLHDIAEHYLKGASKVAVLDIHTGFGEYGDGIVMSYDPPGSDKYARVSGWIGDSIFTPGSDANIPSHTGQRPFEWIESRIEGAEVTAAILEFGTLDPNEIGEIFNANHHFHVYGDPLSDAGRKWGRRYRRYCYPEEDDWMDMVWPRGREVIDLVLQGLGNWRA